MRQFLLENDLHIWMICLILKSLIQFIIFFINQTERTELSIDIIMTLAFPTHLTLEHLFDSERKIKIHSQKPSLQKPIQADETNEIESILKMVISYDQQQSYDPQFVRIFILIKINALMAPQCHINQEFVSALIDLYNSGQALLVNKGHSDEQVFAQIILQGQLHKYIKIHNIQNILSGQCLLATSLAVIIKETQSFLQKAELTFTLSFLALSGRPQAFVPIVHKQKNHDGQIKFASIIQNYIKTNQSEKYLRIDIESRKVQDPYSMRCAPQVYGVVYECLSFMKKDLDSILNKLHFKKIHIQGQEFDNIDLWADTEVLKGDFLVCSLNEIGSMAFLRSQRILNIYLGKNQVHKQCPKQVFELKQILQKTIHLIADNKLLCPPSNGDTMNIDNYERDVYFTPCKVYEKFTKMMSNLYKTMLLEIQTALLGLENVYNIGEGQIFSKKIVRENFFKLQNNCVGSNRKQALFFIKNDWEVYGSQKSL